MKIPEEQLESLLRRAPSPQPPANLRGQLVKAIPQGRTDGNAAVLLTEQSGWRRWWPVLAGGSVACACLAFVGVQQAQIRTLQEEVRSLKEAVKESGGDKLGMAAADNLAVPASSMEVPMADGAGELVRLRDAATELNAEIAALQAMRSENDQLRHEAASQAGLSAEEVEGLSQARDKARRIQCVNNLKQLGLAGRIWANDNNDAYPADILSMANEMGTPKILVCPADEGREPAADWASFSPANLSYQYLAASAGDLEPQRVMFLCPIHRNVTLFDGSVQQLSAERYAQLIHRDGKVYMSEPSPALYLGEPSAAPQNDPGTGMDRRLMERYGLTPEMIEQVERSGLSPEMMERYGIQPAAGQPSVPAMRPELMERYGLTPTNVPADAQPEGDGNP